MAFIRLATALFFIAALLLLTTVYAGSDGKKVVKNGKELKEILSRQVCPACPSRCLRRRRAIRFCRTICARRIPCRVVQDFSCPRRRRFRCVPRARQPVPPQPAPPQPAPPQPAVPTTCPNICRGAISQAINDCSPVVFRILGCVVRNCVFGGGVSGFICALPLPITTSPPTVTTATTMSTAATTMATTASTAATTAVSPTPTATPSRTPTPSPSCQLTMQGSIGQPGIFGVCTCGTSTSTVILLQATGGISQACLNACYDDLLEDICVPNTFFRFASLGSGVVASCCTTVCGGMTIPEFNQCGPLI